jgi:hypothetical protein
MESKGGSILLLISGILTAIGAFIVLILGVFGLFSNQDVVLGAIFLLFMAIILGIVSGLKFWASSLMKSPMTVKKGGVIALVVGIFTGFDLLAVIGGILGIVAAEK